MATCSSTANHRLARADRHAGTPALYPCAGVSFFKRVFSADYRAAVAAEAAGDLELAAERYALAGEHEAAVRVHVARARRTESRDDAIKALRDALHWAREDDNLRREVTVALGRALLGKARSQGVATQRDRERVRDAAKLLAEGGQYEDAGDALEDIGDDKTAAKIFEMGGLVFRMESALSRMSDRADRNRAVRDAFAEYEVHSKGGDRTAARDALRRCVEEADRKAEYRQLLDDLDSRLIGGGLVVLKRRTRSDGAVASLLTLRAGPELTIGRDSLCDFVLRSGGVSRVHAAVGFADPSTDAAGTPDNGSGGFVLSDRKSRNGTLVGGMPIAGAVPLVGSGQFGVGEDCTIDFEVFEGPSRLVLRAQTGLDRGAVACLFRPGDSVNLADLWDLAMAAEFRDDRPWVRTAPPDKPARLNGELIARGDIQLIHGDSLVVDGVEVDVV